VEDLLQQMIDQGRLDVSDEGKEEQHICMQFADERSFGRPKPLVVYFTKDAAPQKPLYPSVIKPVLFPYRNNHTVPWRYAPPSVRKEEATDISSLSAKVTNITGLSSVTCRHNLQMLKGRQRWWKNKMTKRTSLRMRIFQ